MADKMVVQSAGYVEGSTRRIASLTAGLRINPPSGPPPASWPGDSDPDGAPHPNHTCAWGVHGVDLGANTDHDGKLFFFFGDVPPENYDLVAYSTDAYPEPNGVHLTPLLQPNGQFNPFQIRFRPNATPVKLGRDQTPTGAFSYDGKAYVFAFYQLSPPSTESKNGHFGSFLTRSFDPVHSPVFDNIFELSHDGRFMQVAPYVVQNSTIEGLPSAAGDGLILFGNDHNQGIFLAWMPLFPGQDPDKSQIRYWLPGGWSEPGAPESSAQLLFSKSGWTSISVGRIKELGVWIFLYQTAILVDGTVSPVESSQGRIVARVAGTPWDLAHATEVVLFDPKRDDPEQKYLLHPNGYAYGGYVLDRYTRWNDDDGIVTIWYLLSPFDPYQVQLMRSQIKITAQFVGTFGNTPPNYRPFWIYVETDNGDLMWYRKESISQAWQGPVRVGTGWNSFRAIIPAGGNSLYGITPDGLLKWYRHDGFNDGRLKWQGPINVGTGWEKFIRVFSGSDGILYAIEADGTLWWYRHYGFADGSNTWDTPKKVGNGWSGFTHVFSMGEGIIYAVQPDGTLLWYHHEGFATGAASWKGPTIVGSGWNVFRDIVPVGDGLIIGARSDGNLFWYKHIDYQSGTTLGGRPKVAMTKSAHWDGPVQIANQWKAWRIIIGLLPATPIGPR